MAGRGFFLIKQPAQHSLVALGRYDTVLIETVLGFHGTKSLDAVIVAVLLGVSEADDGCRCRRQHLV